LPIAVPDAPREWIWLDDWDGMEDLTSAFFHATVLQDELVEGLVREPRGVYVDATLGAGGHTEALLARYPDVRVIGVDRDPNALRHARMRLERFGDRFASVHSTFGSLAAVLEEQGISQVDGLCADLGVSSPQLDDPRRGMSFRSDGPLDMRMDPSQGETALELLDRLAEDEVADVIFRFGDERRSRRIARSIKRALEQGELQTTLDLRRAVVRAVGPARIGGVDPATRTFQAIRIAVNDELGELEALLRVLPDVLAPGGRAAIIAFHSLEDRLVKRAFRDPTQWQACSKKPVVASEEECERNPRARSAKLRIAERMQRHDRWEGA
jgi:16S rRNA (cytosine1402-N4)-methyltransferase